MAITDINLSGKVRADDGSGVEGAIVTILQTAAGLGGTLEATYSGNTDANGTWTFTETTLTANYDVKISTAAGDQLRYIPWSDEITLKTVDASVMKVRGAASTAHAPIYLFANLATDAGDGWRIEATNSDTFAIGSDKHTAGTIIDYITITNATTAAASSTTILGQLTIGVNDTGADVKFFGATSGKYWLWDESADGVVQIGTLTIGVDDTGHDVKFFGATAGQYFLWDESADELVLAGDTKLSFHDAAGGENIIASANGHLEVNAGTTLDVTAPTVDINASTAFTVDTAGISLDSSGASNLTTSGGALTITSAAAATWSTAAGALTVNGTGGVNIQEGGATIVGISDARVLATTNTASVDLDASGAIQVNSSGGAISVANDNVDQTVNLATAGTRTLNIGINDGTDVTTVASKGNITQTGTITVGVNDTGYDVKFFGATASAYMLWDESEDDLVLAGAAGIDLAGNIDVDGTANLDAVDIDGNVQLDGTLTVGTAGSGQDVTFHSATGGDQLTWDASEEVLAIQGTSGQTALNVQEGNLVVADTMDANGVLDVAGATITGALIPTDDDTYDLGSSSAAWQDLFLEGDLTMTDAGTIATSAGALTITSAAAATWSTAAAALTIDGYAGITLQTTGSGNVTVAEVLDITDATDSSDATGDTGALRTEGGASIAKKLFVGTALDVDGTTNLDAVDIDGNVQADGTITVGADTSGYDVKFFGATTGTYMLWDENTNDLILTLGAGLKFYDAGGEKITGDGSNMTLAAGNNITLSPGADVKLPNDKGLIFGDDGEKIEGDGTDLTIDSSGVLKHEIGGVSKQQIGTITTTNGYVGSVVTQQSEDTTAVRNMVSRYVLDLQDSIASTTTVAIFTPSATSSIHFRSYVKILFCGGNTGGVGDGAVLDRTFYIDVDDGTLAQAKIVDGLEDAHFPAVTMALSGSTFLLQVASNNGSNGMEGGIIVFELYHSPGHGVATIAVT
jgi:hypothetical protein